MAGASPYLLSPEEIREAGMRLFGDRPGWQSRLAETVGRDRSSVTRWLTGGAPPPPDVSLLIRYMLRYGTPETALEDPRD